MTEFTDFLLTILTLDISFIAYKVLNFFRSTFQTLYVLTRETYFAEAALANDAVKLEMGFVDAFLL
jgi:hypothetical protein